MHDTFQKKSKETMNKQKSSNNASKVQCESVINLVDYYSQRSIRPILALAAADSGLIFLYVADGSRLA